jgi:hypothetical protein
MLFVVFTSFVCGASAALVVFFAHPLSPLFWRHFAEFWGFLWFWERGTLCAFVWGAFAVAALFVHRPRLGHSSRSRLALASSIAGFLTSAIAGQLTRVFGSSAFVWLGLGALLGTVLNVGLISWLGSRSAEPAVHPKSETQ